MGFSEAADRYLRAPSKLHLEQLHEAIRASRSYSPGSEFIREASPLLRGGQYQAAIDVIDSWMPGAFLSPCAHTLMSEALTALGRHEEAETEASLSRMAVLAIISSGKGTRANPWRVLRVSDEYDMIKALRRDPVEQQAVMVGEVHLDFIRTSDGREHWFELRTANRTEEAVSA